MLRLYQGINMANTGYEQLYKRNGFHVAEHIVTALVGLSTNLIEWKTFVWN